MKSPRISRAIVAVLAVLLAGTVPAAARQPRPLPGSAEARTFVLAQDVRAYTLTMVGGRTGYFVARACVYTQAFQDSSGGYYVGGQGCLKAENVVAEGQTTDYLGGIWIPAKPAKPPRVYGVVGLDHDTCLSLKWLLCTLAKMEVGRFKLVPGKMNPEAAQAIAEAVAQPPAST